jgi:hypothetical protein
MDHEVLTSLHPMFKLPEVRIYWCDNVQKVCLRNDLQPRVLVIASFGLILFRRGSFNFQSRISSAISFCDLVSLYVADSCASFSSKQVQIRVKHDKIQQAALLVYLIRQTQIPSDILSFTANLSDDALLESGMRPETTPYQPPSVFFDRILSCASHYNLVLTSALLSQAILPVSKSFDITRDLLQSPLFPSILLSLTYEQDVAEVRLHDIHLASFLSHCSSLFRYNRFVQSLLFDRVDFADAAPILGQMFEKPHGFRPTHWSFVDCDLSRPFFSSFFDAIILVDRQMSSLLFRNCVISPDVFQSIFQSIFFNECCHSLGSFAIEQMALERLSQPVLELTCCSWAMQSKCLKRISLVDCGIDGSVFIAQFLQFDIGLQELNLSGNVFNQPLPALSALAPKEFRFLGLARCRSVSLAFLSSFLDLFGQNLLRVASLDLSDLRLSSDANMSAFLDRLSQLAVPGLESLVADNWAMNSSQVIGFTQFLSRQNLTSLSLNCSIDISGSPIGLTAFISVLAGLRLRHLSIRSDGSMRFSFGQLMIPMLALEMMKGVEYLDVTNHAIGEKGLDVLAGLLDNGALSALFCDGSTESFEAILRFAERLIGSNVSATSCPLGDFDRAFRLLAMGQDLAIMSEKKEGLLRRFSEKFPPVPDPADRIQAVFFSSVRLPVESTPRRTSDRRRTITRSDSDNFIPKGFESATEMGPEVDALFRECIVAEEGVDPILAIITSIHDRMSFEVLVAEAKS